MRDGVRLGLFHRLRVVTFISICLILFVVIATIILNNRIREVELTKNTVLDGYEYSKMVIMEDIRSYLLVKDKDSYARAKERTSMLDSLKDELYGENYNPLKFVKADSVTFLDAQYSLDGDNGETVFYYLVRVRVEGEVRDVNFVVFTKELYPYHIEAY